MSRKTFAQLRTIGMALGGNDTIDSFVKDKMTAWFRHQYEAYAWPFLIRVASGLTLTAGTQNAVIGAGDGGLTSQITRIFGPVYFLSGGFTTRGSAPIVQQLGQDPFIFPPQVDPSSQTGNPQQFIYQQAMKADGRKQIALLPYPIPDRNYTISFNYQLLPDDLADTDVPLYPNEDTLIQACKVATMEYNRSNTQGYMEQAQILAEKVAADRDSYGGTQSFGETLQLDSNTFGTAGAPVNSKWWPSGW